MKSKVLINEEDRQGEENQRDSSRRKTGWALLVLKREEGTMSQGLQGTSRRC